MKGKLTGLKLCLLSVAIACLAACRSTPENLDTYYYQEESNGNDIALWIAQPELIGETEEWISQLVHNQISENFSKFSPVDVVERDNNIALQEIMRNEDIAFDEESVNEFGFMKSASHAMTTTITSIGDGNSYSINMTLLKIETNSQEYVSNKIFTADSSDFSQKLINTVNTLSYQILTKHIGVKLTPVGKELLTNKIDEESLDSSESLAKAKHEYKKAEKAEKLRQEALEKAEHERQRAELAKQQAEMKALEKAEKKEQRKKTQRKQQLNIAFTIGQDFYGIDAQIHFTGVNHWFLGVEGGVLAKKEEFALMKELRSSSKSSTQTASIPSNATTQPELELQDIIKYNVAGVTGVNFSLFDKMLAPYAKIGAGYLNDSKNGGFGLLGGMGLYCTIPQTGFIIFFDYTAHYLWERYFFDKYTVGVGLDFSSVM